jgi:hypothetical protein
VRAPQLLVALGKKPGPEPPVQFRHHAPVIGDASVTAELGRGIAFSEPATTLGQLSRLTDSEVNNPSY